MTLLKQQRGAGLIEVMVTVLILSTSLLGLAAMQAASLQYNHSAYLRSQANILAYDLLDRVRLNRARMSDYNLDLDSDPPGAGGTLAKDDLIEWHDSVSDSLPDGDGGIDCDAAQRLCTIEITWSEQNSTGEESEDSTTFQYTTKI
ncbi:type IV pilus modification protein PilV [Microbulbifer sp. YPW16]|uniref:type IV pilus modification protein PilV n=1 Tax=unclassified Microbulbifer TaxID=2619833 RepID=UPI001E2D1E57|nr:type IV pilus modification protein PilV [Microbulbifer sp. YPW16]UHQ54548.1 type IV pilus modification protein PilV [Microbulbifer sp. YPW16]